MSLLHPKALRVSNLMEGFLEEMRHQNELVYFREQTQRKAVLYELAPVIPNEGEAVSPAAPLKQPVLGYAVAMALGFTVAAGVFGLAFGLYWLLRIYL